MPRTREEIDAERDHNTEAALDTVRQFRALCGRYFSEAKRIENALDIMVDSGDPSRHSLGSLAARRMRQLTEELVGKLDAIPASERAVQDMYRTLAAEAKELPDA